MATDSPVKTAGVVYTPPALAALLVREGLGAAGPQEARHVLDPACGDGGLLGAAATAGVPPEHLCGVDIDPGAIAAARRRLGPDARLRTGDCLGLALDQAFPDVAAAGGFDVVLGNPPYVRQERLGGRKSPLAEHYACFHGGADLYIYFLERGLAWLRPGGRLAFVVPNKWLRVAYAARLRGLLATGSVVERVIDFGHTPLFAGADAFPSVIVLRREAPTGATTVQVATVPRRAPGPLAAQVSAHSHPVPQSRWGMGPWGLAPAALDTLLARISERGTPLAQVLGSPLRRGVLTGLNAAFVVDGATRAALVAADPGSAEVLHPVARGRDLARWRVAAPDAWLIGARRGLDLGRYPAVLAHLEGFRDRLTPRGPGAGGPGRKPGRYRWHELQDTTAYWSIFDRPKLVHADLAWRPAFALVREPLVLLNTAYVWPTDDLFLLGVVNSPVMWLWLWHHATHGKDEVLRLIRSVLETVPVPDPSDSVRRGVSDAVAELCAGAAGARAAVLERQVSDGVLRAFGLDADDGSLLARHAPPRMPPGWSGR